MNIYLIRHARSAANEKKVWTGQSDAPLCAKGIAEQRALCGSFSYPVADFYFSSPLSRCVKSFEIIYERAPDVLLHEFIECALGALEGTPYTSLDDDKNYTEWLENPNVRIKGAESFASFEARVCRGFSALLKTCREARFRSAAGVVHGDVMRVILRRFADNKIAARQWKIPNGGMYALEFDEHGACVSLQKKPDFLFR